MKQKTNNGHKSEKDPRMRESDNKVMANVNVTHLSLLSSVFSKQSWQFHQCTASARHCSHSSGEGCI